MAFSCCPWVRTFYAHKKIRLRRTRYTTDIKTQVLKRVLFPRFSPRCLSFSLLWSRPSVDRGLHELRTRVQCAVVSFTPVMNDAHHGYTRFKPFFPPHPLKLAKICKKTRSKNRSSFLHPFFSSAYLDVLSTGLNGNVIAFGRVEELPFDEAPFEFGGQETFLLFDLGEDSSILLSPTRQIRQHLIHRSVRDVLVDWITTLTWQQKKRGKTRKNNNNASA